MQFHLQKRKNNYRRLWIAGNKINCKENKGLRCLLINCKPRRFIKIQKFSKVKGIILSGGPSTVTTKKDSKLFPKKYFMKKYQFLEFVMDFN